MPPSTLVEIGENAFWGCKKLKEITLPEGLRKIRKYAFSGCAKLEEIMLPHTLTRLETEEPEMRALLLDYADRKGAGQGMQALEDLLGEWEYVGLSKMSYRLGKAKSTDLGDFQLRGLMGKLL